MIPMDNPNWCAVRDALASVSHLLRRLKPAVMSTTHVGPTNGDPERYHVTLDVHTDCDLQPDEKQLVIDQARQIIESCLQRRGYPLSALATFTYGVMYANSDRNMKVVGTSLKSVLPKLRTLYPPVVSTCHLGPFSGEPDDFTIYLSVESKEELEAAVKLKLIEDAKPLIERELRSHGYPFEAIDSFSYEILRQEDIEKAGGWYAILR